MQLVTPYQDISEIGNMYRSPSCDELANFETNWIKTPIAFAHWADRDGYCAGSTLKKRVEKFQEAGWEHVTSCLNWHNAHNGDVEMQLWMKKFPKNLPIDRPTGRSHMYGEHKSFLYGCGGRIIEPNEVNDADLCRKIAKAAPRYLTLLRVPAEQKVDAAWLRAMNYRPLPQFSTSVADYWVNGFENWTRDSELAFWDTWKQPGEKRAKL